MTFLILPEADMVGFFASWELAELFASLLEDDLEAVSE